MDSRFFIGPIIRRASSTLNRLYELVPVAEAEEMPKTVGKILVCSCEGTMPLDVDGIGRGCGKAGIETARQLCRAEVDQFQAAAAENVPLTIGCTQEKPLFIELAGDHRDSAITYVNLRETAGWSKGAEHAGPKMAALIAAAQEPLPEVPMISLESEGVVLIYGSDERAIEAGILLQDHLDVTVLMKPPAAIAPPRSREFPIAKGTVVGARGYLGNFELTVNDFAQPDPSSRAELTFGQSRNGAVSRCDVILDVSGDRTLFTGGDLRDGYIRADHNDPAAVLRAVLKARDLVGTFEKPRYVNFTAGSCAHSRSRIVGCRRCLDVCPAGAITPAGDHVTIDANICGGCGHCAAVCPTGAASYALPPADALIRKLRTLIITHRAAGGERPVLLVHDETHGIPLIDALARFGEGLPPNVLPLTVNEVTQIGLEFIAAGFAYGVAAVRFLHRAQPRHDTSTLNRTLTLSEAVLTGLGLGAGRIAVIATDDPDQLGAELERDQCIPPRATTGDVSAGRRQARGAAVRTARASTGVASARQCDSPALWCAIRVRGG